MAEQAEKKSEILIEPGKEQLASPVAVLVGKAKRLLPLVLIPAVVGAGLVYTKFEAVAAVGQTLGMDFGTKDAEEEEEPVTYGEFMQIDGMIINPAGSQGKRYLLISIGLESHQPVVLEEVKQKEVVVRDVILKVLGTRTVDELADITGRSQLKDQVRLAVNEVLQGGEIDQMYFTQYVIQ